LSCGAQRAAVLHYKRDIEPFTLNKIITANARKDLCEAHDAVFLRVINLTRPAAKLGLLATSSIDGPPRRQRPDLSLDSGRSSLFAIPSHSFDNGHYRRVGNSQMWPFILEQVASRRGPRYLLARVWTPSGGQTLICFHRRDTVLICRANHRHENGECPIPRVIVQVQMLRF
jgi:hypothetical protein